MCGLCGSYDNNANNDFTTRCHAVVVGPLAFGNSWKDLPNCPDAQSISNPCTDNPYRQSWAQKQCSIILSDVFSACHSSVGCCWSQVCCCGFPSVFILQDVMMQMLVRFSVALPIPPRKIQNKICQLLDILSNLICTAMVLREWILIVLTPYITYSTTLKQKSRSKFFPAHYLVNEKAKTNGHVNCFDPQQMNRNIPVDPL